MALHHNTIRNYTAALLDFFNNLEVQHNDSNGVTIVKSVPVVYSSREKSKIIDTYSSEQLISGNYNVLPRASLSMSVLAKLDQRSKNKNIKINTKSNVDTFDYSFNSVPYEFTFELSVMCRGMNEATQIVEQLAPKFNPTLNLDVWDAQNLNKPTRIPVRLLDIGFETEEYEEISSNIVTVSFGISMAGNLYQPINTVKRIKAFKMNINEQVNTNFNRKIIDNWDVAPSGSIIAPGTTVQVQNSQQYPPVIIDLVPLSPLIIGTNTVTAIWDDKDNKVQEMTFQWALLQGTGTIQGTTDTVNVTITATGTTELQLTLTDIFGNYVIFSKVFTV